MNDEEGLFSTRDSLPEEIRKNTVAMGKIPSHAWTLSTAISPFKVCKENCFLCYLY